MHSERSDGMRNAMSLTVCIAAQTIDYPQGGGHKWVYLNWALGLRALGCQVTWLELVDPETTPHEVQLLAGTLKRQLEPYGLGDCIALGSETGEALAVEATAGYLNLEAATTADLLLNFQYEMPAEMVRSFRRSALVDIDPGLLQLWASSEEIHIAPHDVYFTIGETVGRPGAPFPDLGLEWLYTPPWVALDWWRPQPAAGGAPFSTVAHWYASANLNDGAEAADKRSSFTPFLELPRIVDCPLELAIDMGPESEEAQGLRRAGWRVRHAWAVARTPGDYQRYIQNSLGEFSCAKPSYVRLQNAWLSDRTLCY